MKIWAVANQKGGVGKTTTAVTLAGHLVARGKRVLVVDMDPHGSMSAYFGLDPDEVENSLYTLFQHDKLNAETIKNAVVNTQVDGLHLLPASTALATLDRQLGSQEGKGLVLKNSMALLEDEYDFVLIDCPPLLGILMVNALAACELLLLPVQTEFLALKGLDRMMRTLNMIIKARKNTLEYLIVPTMFDRRTRASLESLRALRKKYDSDVWDQVIPVDTKFREASRKGVPLSNYFPEARGAKAYDALLTSLLNPVQESHLKLVTS